MKLRPLVYQDLRRKKTLDHYYSLIERWWELSGQPVADWRHHRSGLDAVALDGAAREKLANGIVDFRAAQILDQGHDHWFRTTERECDDADEYPHEDPLRLLLVSRHGVIIVLIRGGRVQGLITAFRPDRVEPENPDFPSAAQAYVHRYAVRRAQRRTSFSR